MSFFREPRPEDVTKRVLKDFPVDQAADVLAVLSRLDEVGDDRSWSAAWLQFACLRLESGRKDRLLELVQLALQDARDLQLAVEGQFGGDWLREYIVGTRRN